MSTQYDDLQGTETPVHEHPDSTSTGVQTRLAGDVVPFPQSFTEQAKGTVADVINKATAQGAHGGYKNTDMTNIKVLRPSSK